MSRSSRRLLGLLALAGFLGSLLVLGASRPAGAHAIVVASSPAAGQVVTRAPGEVWVQFSEPVVAEAGGLRVLDATGDRVDEGSSPSSGREVLRAELRPGLGDGTYVMDYRVVSADGHPIAGAIVFGVGEGTTIDAGVAAAAEPDEGGLEVAAGVARFATYVGSLLAAGLALFLAFFLVTPPSSGAGSGEAAGDRGPSRRRGVRTLRAAAIVGALGAVAVVGIQATLVTGRGVSSLDVDGLRRALDGGLGWSTAVLLVGLAVVHVSAHLREGTASRVLAFYGWLAVAASFALWGHTGTAEPRWLGIAADVVHTAAAAVWLGGLVGLALLLVDRGRAVRAIATAEETQAAEAEADARGAIGSIAQDAAGVVLRFSDAAAVSVAALVVAGIGLGITQVSSLGQLTSTRYGQLLLVKVGLVVVVLAIAAYNRWRLRPALGSEPDAWRRLRSTVWGEVVAILAALAVTSALVAVTPARTAGDVAPVATFQAPLALGGDVNVTVTPADVGANVAHVQYYDDVGRPLETVRSVTVELARPDGSLGPISSTATRAGPGHYIASGIQVPATGAWDLTFVARVGDFDQDRTTFPLSVG